jgi:hypothetical protein
MSFLPGSARHSLLDFRKEAPAIGFLEPSMPWENTDAPRSGCEQEAAIKRQRKRGSGKVRGRGPAVEVHRKRISGTS